MNLALLILALIFSIVACIIALFAKETVYQTIINHKAEQDIELLLEHFNLKIENLPAKRVIVSDKLTGEGKCQG